MREFCLDFLTVSDVAPQRIVEIAAANGLRRCTLPVHPIQLLPDYELRGDTYNRRETLARLRDLDVIVDMIEAFGFLPDTDLETLRPSMESGAVLGTRKICISARRDDPERGFERLATVVDMAAEYGLTAVLEPARMVFVRTIAHGLELIARLVRPNVALGPDSLHFFRANDSYQSVIDAADRIVRFQFSDGPSERSSAEYYHDALWDRMLPGKGELPLDQLVAVVPDDIVIGVELPQKSRADAGVPAEVRARDAIAAVRRLFERPEGE